MRFRRHRLLLAAGVAAPVTALLAIVLGLIAYPGFSQAHQYLSELGGPGSRAPLLFNVGIFAAGLMAVLAGLGFAGALRALAAPLAAVVVIALAFGLGGFGMMAASLVPWPDPRHHLLINLGLGIEIAPLLLLWGLARTKGFAGLKIFLVLIFALMAVLTWITWPGLCPAFVSPGNVGYWERTFAVTLVGWVAVAALLLDRRLILESEKFPPSLTRD